MNYLTTLVASAVLFMNTGVHTDAKTTHENSNAYDSYYHGMVPYANCYGRNASCSDWGCSEVVVNANDYDPVLVIIKRNGTIIKNAIVAPSRSYKFEMKNGNYQVFFYYGDNWDSNKYMGTSSSGCVMRGGWAKNEVFTKDDSMYLSNEIITYTLERIVHGNFSTKGSSKSEIF